MILSETGGCAENMYPIYPNVRNRIPGWIAFFAHFQCLDFLVHPWSPTIWNRHLPQIPCLEWVYLPKLSTTSPPSESPQTNHPSFCHPTGRKRCFWAFRVPTSTACICGTVGTSWCKLKRAHAPPGHARGCVVAVSSPMRFVFWGGNKKHAKFFLMPHNSNKSVEFSRIQWNFTNIVMMRLVYSDHVYNHNCTVVRVPGK